MSKRKSGLTRRQFIGTVATGAAAAAALTVIPRHVLGATGGKAAPSDSLNFAFIGVGGRGRDDLNELSKLTNVYALCDVDEKQAGNAFGTWSGAKKYKDFRKMLDEVEKSIDGVCVATPDHVHAVAAMNAIKRGKHVYCEKPLAHSIYEVRQLAKAAQEHKVTTQLGNQGHSYDECAMFVEWVRDGAIGTVKEIHCTCDGCYSAIGTGEDLKKDYPVPATLDWDLWLGPAKKRPYNPHYVPGSWRHFFSFGTSTAGDWVCHVVDPPFWALELGSPISVETTVKDFNPKTDDYTFPRGNQTKFEFAAKGARPAVTLTWYEGTLVMPRPAELEAGRKLISPCGYIVGDKGGISWGSHGAAGMRIYPEEKMKAYKRPAETLPRRKNTYQRFVEAIKAGGKANSDFADYGGPLTEIALLTIIGSRFAGKKLEWDGPGMKFKNCPEADALITPEFREGWKL